MASLSISIISKSNGKKILAEMDADRLEKLAASLGFFSDDFLKSLKKAKKIIKQAGLRKLSLSKS